MTAPTPRRPPVLIPVLLVSAGAWALLLAQARGLVVPEVCAMTVSGPNLASLDLTLALNPPAALAAGWALMLAAMMTPLLLEPLRHLYQRSLPSRRLRTLALFALGYAAVWMAAGAVLLTLALFSRLLLLSPWLAPAAATLAAIAWQASPARQRCLNRRHRLPPVTAFGPAADRAAAVFGLSHGLWCVGACWALMLLPLVLPVGHLTAMAAVAFWLLSEHLEQPWPPQWGWRWPLKAVRIAVHQARLRTAAGENSIRSPPKSAHPGI